MNALLPVPAPASAQPSPVKIALDDTWRVLGMRLRNLRRCAVGALALLLASLLAAAVGRSVWWLWGLASLPLMGFFYSKRERDLVYGWENLLLDLWAGSGMYLSVVTTTLSLHPTPLKASLDGMLALLPVEGRSQTATPTEKSLRRALAATRQRLEARRTDRACLAYLGVFSLTLGGTLAAAVSVRAGATVAVFIAVALGASATAYAASQRNRWRRRLKRIHGDTPWEQSALLNEIGNPEWAGLPAGYRRELQALR